MKGARHADGSSAQTEQQQKQQSEDDRDLQNNENAWYMKGPGRKFYKEKQAHKTGTVQSSDKGIDDQNTPAQTTCQSTHDILLVQSTRSVHQGPAELKRTTASRMRIIQRAAHRFLIFR